MKLQTLTDESPGRN